MKSLGDVARRQYAFDRFCRMQRMTGGDFVLRHQAAFFQHGLKRRKPDLVIGHRQIFARRTVLTREARHIDIPAARHAHRQRQRKGALFPVAVEDRLVRLRLDRAVAVRAAKVLTAVHFATSFGDFGRPVPIMESRVTRSASFSSLQPSVPAGRMGNTR